MRANSLQKETNRVKLPEIAPHRPASGVKGNSFGDDGFNEGNSNIQPSMIIQPQGFGLDMQSPFRLPSDEEVFLFRENDRQRKQELKATSGNLQIWEKKTASNRTQLKHYKNYQTITDDKFTSKTAYNDSNRTDIQMALEIAQERQKNRENGVVKEPIVNLIEQKKEMFLVTMAHGIIKNEIQKLKQTSEEKKLALELSEKMLEQDHENFQKYLENNKQQKVDAENRADGEIKEKKLKDQEIKSLNIRLTSLRTEQTRNLETVVNYNEHKEFLDKLAPKEWNDQKEKKRKERINQIKEQWIQKQIDGMQTLEDDNADAKKSKRERVTVLKKNSMDQKSELDAKFNKLVEEGKFVEIDDFEDEYEMFFKAPQQLVELFNDLEEKNLFQIQRTQESKQLLEELKMNFTQIIQEREQKLNFLSVTKDEMRKKFDAVNMQIRILQTQGSEKDQRKDSKDLRKQIIDTYEIFKDEINLHDYQHKETLDILGVIELQLEKQLKQIKSLPPKSVELQRQECEKQQKQKQREEHNNKIKLEQEEKTMRNQKKTQQPSQKKMGRQDMFRSAPFEKIEIKQEETINNEEEEDKKYFIE